MNRGSACSGSLANGRLYFRRIRQSRCLTRVVNRWVECEGCDNFRDVGGYFTSDGRVTRWGALYRSDALGRLSDAGADRFAGLNVRTVIDLRTEHEVARLPLPVVGANRTVSVAMDNPEIDAIRGAGAEGMSRLYLWNLDVKQEGIARIVTLLADPANIPAVIQCNAGKDRTGICVALILELLGVADAAIIEDYRLTDEVRARVPEAKFQEAVRGLAAAGLDPAILGAQRETMTEFLGGFRERWGSAEDYVKRAGVSAKTIELFRRNLLDVRR